MVNLFMQHPDWNRFTLDNDIALLKLESSANLNSTMISGIPKLSNSSIDKAIMEEDNSKCFVTGWGYTTFDGMFLHVFLTLKAPIKMHLKMSSA